MKKIALFLLALLLPMAALGLGFTVDGINYEPLGGWGNYVTVKGPANNDCPAHVFIPSTVTYEDVTYSVASVSSGAFWGYTNLESIYMADGLESIDPNTFSYCTSLKQVRFPETLNTILGPGLSHHVGAFEGCTSLESIYLPASMSFKGFATSPNNICRWAFKNCTNLKTVVIAAKQPNIEDEAFINCPSLTCVISYVNPPYQLGDNTFTGLSSNASLIVPDGTKSAYQSLAGWSDFLYTYEHGSYSKAFAVVTAGRGGRIAYSGDEVAVGTQVWVITKGQSASFTITPDDGHKLLKLLKDGQDVTAQVSNGKYTVQNIQQDFTLEAVFEEGEDTPPVGDYITFADPIVEKLCLYYWDTNKDGRLTKQEAAAVTSLGDVFCLNPQKTKSWQGSDGPKDGLQHANFYWFNELQYFTGLTSIDDEAFYSQQSLQQITLPANIKKIGKYAFYNCWNLQDINIPNSVETIGQGAFANCKNAGSLSIGSSIKTIGNAAFYDCVNLSSVVVPDGCTTIGSSAFLGCTKLEVLTLPASLKNVGTFMIGYAKKTVSIRLGSKDLWQQLQIAYDDDEPEDGIVEQSDFKLYYNDQELTEVEIPQTMTKVDNRYKNCQSVKSLTIHAIVTDIAVCAFNGCRNLTSVTSYLQDPFYIEDAVFEYEDPNTHNDVFTSATLYVPKGTKAKYQSQYGWKNFKNIVEMGGEPAQPEPYVVYNNGTLTFYYDNQRSSRQGTTYDLSQKLAEEPGWLGHSGAITKVIFDISFANARPVTTYEWFYYCGGLSDIYGIENLNTSQVTNMTCMFSGCAMLTQLDLSHFDTRHVNNFEQMFEGCTSLTSLDLSSFNTEMCTNMTRMFNRCSSLESICLTYFNTENVVWMGSMFLNCTSLKSIDVSSFKTNRMVDMESMFMNCTSLTHIDLSSFDTSYAMSMPYATYGAYYMNHIFSGCINLESVVFGNKFVTSNEQYLDKTFESCGKLQSVTFTGDIPASINSKFFEGVGTADCPATLDVPEQYRNNYKAQFDGNKFFGGYFKLSGEEHLPQLAVTFLINDVDGVVYDKELRVRVTATNIGSETFKGSLFALYRKMNENGEWSGGGGPSVGTEIEPGKTRWVGTRLTPPEGAGHYMCEYGYETESGTDVTVGMVEFDYLPDDRYVTIVNFDNVKMMTYCNENDLDFAGVSGLKAYTAGGFNTATSEAMMMRVTDVPAQTGILIAGNFPGAYLVPKTTSSTIYVNMLVGVLKSQYVKRNTDDGYTNYVFKDGANGLAFYIANQGTGSYVWENEAYLQIPTQSAGSREIITLKFDDIDGIAEALATDQPFDVYTLGGQLVKRGVTSLKQLPKGIYIVNGHKVAIK